MSHNPVDARGFWLGIAAYSLWGVSPLFWNLLGDVPVVEVLAHRVVWSVPILLIVVAVRRRWPVLAAQAASKRTVAIAVVAAVMLSINWGLFVWAVTTDRVVEASLGYFINPLFTVALGVVFLHERLTRAQGIAVALASAGVVFMTVRIGSAPWISLGIAAAFGTYGLLKKQAAAAPALEGLLLETSSLMVPAAVLIGLGVAAGDGHFGADIGVSLLLLAAGLATAGPLLIFGESAKRIPLAMLGLIQYVAPSGQFLLGVFVYGEEVGADRLTGFVLVWLGLMLLSLEGLFRRRRTPLSAVAQ